ncbi:MAG: hypothetical protein KGY80_12725 [Candidatus Thorarchaeota archaeon]|nr:hypothetical protein [Candidatus Thorarchaeota archaeon]
MTKRGHILQTQLSDFDENGELKEDASIFSEEVGRWLPRGSIWLKKLDPDKEWGVCRFHDTVLFVELRDGTIYSHGFEARCRWCGGELEIQGEKVFCIGMCTRYQGEFSADLDDYFRWEGAKSYTLRRKIAEVEGLNLQPRDLKPKWPYKTKWSRLLEYDESRQAC